MIPNLKLYLIVGAIVSSLGSSVFFTAKYKDGQYAIKEQKQKDEYIAQLEKQQKEYNEKVKQLTDEANKKQKELSDLNSELERKYAAANKKINNVLSKYNDLLANGWRLRDPGAKPETEPSVPMPSCPQVGHPPATDGGNKPSCSGELSKQASEFLLRFAGEADSVVEQLKTTQEYALRLKKICEK